MEKARTNFFFLDDFHRLRVGTMNDHESPLDRSASALRGEPTRRVRFAFAVEAVRRSSAVSICHASFAVALATRSNAISVR